MKRHDNIGFEVMINLGTLGSINNGGGAWITHLYGVVDTPTVDENGIDDSGKVIADFLRKSSDVCPYLNLGGGEAVAERVSGWIKSVADTVETDLLSRWGFVGADFQHENYEGKLDKATIRIQPHWHQY